MDYYKMGIVVALILVLIRFLFWGRNQNKIIIGEKFNHKKDVVRGKIFDVKRYIQDVKDRTPIALVLLAFVLFLMYAFVYFDKDKVIVFFFIFFISLGVFQFLFKWILEFTLVLTVDINSNPMKIEGWLISYRIRDRFKIVDAEGKPCVLANHLKYKKGKGYFINQMDTENYLFIVSPFHKLSNIHFINDVKQSFTEMRTQASSVVHERNSLKAKQDTLVLFEAVELLDKMNMTKQLTEKLKEKDLVSVSPTEEQMREIILELIEENKNAASQ